MFQEQFAPLVENRIKLQTIRTPRKRMPKPNDLFDGRKWEGLPYRSKQRQLILSNITAVETVEIYKNRIVEADIVLKNEDAFAKADGFDDFDRMLEWFTKTHGLPFHGFVTKWDPRVIDWKLEVLKRGTSLSKTRNEFYGIR
jgi:hypothetical protein